MPGLFPAQEKGMLAERLCDIFVAYGCADYFFVLLFEPSLKPIVTHDGSNHRVFCFVARMRSQKCKNVIAITQRAVCCDRDNAITVTIKSKTNICVELAHFCLKVFGM